MTYHQQKGVVMVTWLFKIMRLVVMQHDARVCQWQLSYLCQQFKDGAASVNEYTQLHNKYICRAAFVKFQLKLLGHKCAIKMSVLHEREVSSLLGVVKATDIIKYSPSHLSHMYAWSLSILNIKYSYFQCYT